MKYLKKSDLHLVKPKFRKIVKQAWNNGEKVPYGVVYLSDKKLTKQDIEWAEQQINLKELDKIATNLIKNEY